MSNWNDDFDDDLTLPVGGFTNATAPVTDSFDDDETIAISQVVKEMKTLGALDDFDDDLTAAAKPSATRPPLTTPPLSAPVSVPVLRQPPPSSVQPWLPPQRPTAPPTPATRSKSSKLPLLIAAAIVLAVLAGVIAFLVLRQGNGLEPVSDALSILGGRA